MFLRSNQALNNKILPFGRQQGRRRACIRTRVAVSVFILALLLPACRPATTTAPENPPATQKGALPVVTAPLIQVPASTLSPTGTLALANTLALASTLAHSTQDAADLATRSPSLTATLPVTPPASPTVDPYTGLGIMDLTSRAYGGGELQTQETMAVNSYFTRTLISYPSDGLAIYGFMDVPRQSIGARQGNPPYPVVIALHGYIDPAIYSTLDYTTRYADALARAGFLVLHPNLRGYPPSDDGDNRFRVGMAIDVLNLIAIVKAQAGKPGPLELADPNAIGIWGHSMGGGISTRVITVSPDIRAAVLYGAMSGDEQKNYERIYNYFSNGTRGIEELQAPLEAFQRISPVNFLDRIQAAVSIHHGKADPDVPPAWSLDLCQRLEALNKPVECFTYPGEGHTFHGEGDDLFIQRMIDFFNRNLRNG